MTQSSFWEPAIGREQDDRQATKPDRPLIFVLGDDHDSADLVLQCLDAGHESVPGELDGGIDTWIAANRPAATIEVVKRTG